jgi:hexosaminidase
MPAPTRAQWSDGRLAIKRAFTATVNGPDDGRVGAALDRMRRRWEERSGLTFARTATAAYQPPTAGSSPTLAIEFTALTSVPQIDDDESYTLEIESSRAVLRAPTSTGALRGIATLMQLFQSDARGWFLPAVKINDAPRFKWRGLLIDVARHWIPLDVILRNLDAMALVKLNVLHLHLTEDQGFRIESKALPKLHELGSDGLYFTQEQIRTIVAYAAARGIRIVPEFDVPGHATTWVVGYPELGSAPGPYAISRHWGVHDVVLDPTNEKLYAVLDAFFGEMAALFPDRYVHIGGDENNGKQWSANARIQEFIRAHNLKDNHGLQAYFNRRLQEVVAKHGKIMVGWDEILHPDIPPTTVVQTWRGADGLAAAARMKFATILSHGYYLDHLLPAATHYVNDPIPADSPLTADEQRRVLGGEACMWGEWATAETIDTRTWPRAAAIAERLWSPREVTDIPDMYRRLALVNQRLEENGMPHETLHASMLRRFAGDAVSRASFVKFQQLADLFEAGTLYVREPAMRDVTQFTPLTGFADCARADSEAAREFADAARALVFGSRPVNAGAAEALSHQLAAWSALGRETAANSLLPHSPRGHELVPLGQWLVDVTAIGREALDALVHGKELPAGASAAQLAKLTKLSKSRLGVTLPIVDSVRLLVAAASLEAKRASTSTADWTAEVERLAAPPPAKK